MAFDGIVTKAIATELQQLSGGRIDKIFQPNKNTIILGFYLDGKNYALNICIDAQNYRFHLTTHKKANPQIAPNFCMVLRKHLIGLRIKNFITDNLERIVTIEFEGLDEFDDVISKKLIIELMGRHSNIILLDENKIIIDSLRHTYKSNESYRDVCPKARYITPHVSKFNFLDTLSFDTFKSKLTMEYIKDSKAYKEILNNKPLELTYKTIAADISNTFNGISKSFANYVLDVLDVKELNDFELEQIYKYIVNIINNIGTTNLSFETIFDTNGNIKDYFLILKKTDDKFALNFFIDDFYYDKENKELFKNYKNSTLKLVLSVLKKYNSRLINIDNKLKECEHMDLYKLYGELITANLYRIDNSHTDTIELENYYDNNNKILIPIDKKYSISTNAKRYFKKYNKLKNTLEIVNIQKKETIKELEYIESIVYELENSLTIEEIAQILDEISESVLFKTNITKKKSSNKFKKSKLTKNKAVSFNPIKYTINGFTILVGRNNKENDYLTMKYADKNDIWFHTKDIHGSHVILKTNNQKIDDEILYKCASIAKEHSKGKNSSNVPIDYCPVKFVKKPSNSKPGMVIYTNNKTIYAN